jgi:hypothetical protein
MESDQKHQPLFMFNSAEKMLKKVSNKGRKIPQKRYKHSFCKNPREPKAYLSGGINKDGPLNEIYEVDLVTYEFKLLKIVSRDPSKVELSARYLHTSHVFRANGKDYLLLIGGKEQINGTTKEFTTKHIYLVDLKTLEWDYLTEHPQAIVGHASAVVADRYLCIHGGTDAAGNFFPMPGFVRYDIHKDIWSILLKQPPLMPGRLNLQ